VLPMPLFWLATVFGAAFAEQPKHVSIGPDSIGVSLDGRGFQFLASKEEFRPWGVNYGHAGLIEDFWTHDWPRVVDDFREMRQLGANVARVHLQFGKFMTALDRPNPAALAQLSRLLRLAEETGIYLDLTGLGSYRPADVPQWYDALDEPARWSA